MKLRADELLLSLGLADNIEKARALLMSGNVLCDEKPLTKPGISVSQDAQIRIKGQKGHNWVSRGALKLEHAIKEFNINPKDMVALDIGASTGGFTDVLLHYGAKKVYAVDVGYGELAWKLRNNPKIVLLERTNARYLSPKEIPETPGIIVCDASFISLKTILPASMALAGRGTILIALIKPQFEAAQDEVGEKGIITDASIHEKVCNEIKEWLSSQSGWQVKNIIPSPITGAEGNKEFLMWGERNF